LEKKLETAVLGMGGDIYTITLGDYSRLDSFSFTCRKSKALIRFGGTVNEQMGEPLIKNREEKRRRGGQEKEDKRTVI